MRLRYLFCSYLLMAFLCAPAFAQSSETDLLSAAQQAFNDGFSDVATKYLQDFLEKYPQSSNLPDAKLLLGQCDFLRGEYGKALDLFGELSLQKDKKDEILFWRGETYLKENRLAEAQHDYKTVIVDFPQGAYVPQAYYSLGWSYFQQKDFSEAQKAFSRLVELFPHNQLSEDASLKIAECDINSGHLKEAITDFQKFMANYPKSSHSCEADFNIAESFYYLSKFEDAVKYYQKTIGASCDDGLKLSAFTAEAWSLMKSGKFLEAQNVLKKTESFSKSKGLSFEEVLLAQANLAYERASLDEALSLFGDFINKYPQSPHWAQGYLGRANVYYLLKEYDKAREDYLHVLNQKDPDIFEKCRFGLGWCAFKLGSLKEAIGYFQEVLTQGADGEARADALIQMADLYQESRQWDDAAGMYERVRKTYPAYNMMDYVLYRQSIAFLNAGKLNAALENFKILQDNFSDSKYLEDINYYLGLITFKQGNWQKGAEKMEAYLRGLTHPSDLAPDANYILALSYLNLKQPEEALNYFQKILRLYPNDSDIAQNADIGIGKCQFELGQGREAVKRFKLVVYKYPKTAAAFEALLWLAQYYLKDADAASAIEYYRAIIDEFPSHPQMDQIHYELGQAYEVQGQSDQALEQYKSISSADAALSGKTRLAIAGIMSKDLDAHRAIAAYESIIDDEPAYAGEAYLKLGLLYRNQQDYEKEEAVYRRALASKQGPFDRAQIQFNLADTLELMSRME